MNMIYLEDIEIGVSRTKSVTYDVAREEIIEFASRWDPRPFHLNDAAASSSVFGEMVACTAHIFSMLSWFGTQGENRVASLAALQFDEVRILRPVRPGDTISCTTKWIEKRVSRTKPDRGIVRTHIALSNQNKEVVFSAIATTMVAKKPK